MKKIVLLGAGGFARELLWLIRDMNLAAGREVFEVIGFVGPEPDDFLMTNVGLRHLGDDEWALTHLEEDTAYVIGIAEPKLRQALDELYNDGGFQPQTLVHPAVNMSEFIGLGEGAVLCAGAVLSTQVEIGRQAVVNMNCSVGYDCKVGDYTFLGPGCHLGGANELGDGISAGPGVSFAPGARVGNWAEIAAGAGVLEDLPAGMYAEGNPAKVVREV